MRIEDYSFGKITVDGKGYTADVIIYPGRVDSSWRRREGHCLHRDDLSDVVNERPDSIIIGTGFYGALKVPQDLVRELVSKGAEVYVKRTAEAVSLFNNLSLQKRTIACLHLTC